MDKEENIIKVSNLTKNFKDFVAVNDISFEVKRGEIFAFLGPNGAGKSTTIKIITTLATPTSGKIEINGHDPLKNKDQTRKSFGIVFQDPSLDDDLTAYENMALHASLYGLPKNIAKSRIQELLEFVELWERRNSFVKTFSGGMKRRLEIARGLLHHPKILFLDEPTIGLDPQTRNHVWSYVKDINEKENMTVFLTTHYMDEAERVADRIAIMDHGKIIATGSSDVLKKKTNTTSLEDAFLALTGKDIREEEASSKDLLRAHRNRFGRR